LSDNYSVALLAMQVSCIASILGLLVELARLSWLTH